MPSFEDQRKREAALSNPYLVDTGDGDISAQYDAWEGNGLGLRESEDDPILQPRAGRRRHDPMDPPNARKSTKRRRK